MKTQKDNAGQRTVVGVFLVMIGFYEHSWLGNNGGAHDTFYIASSWIFWILGPCLSTSGVYTLMVSKKNPPAD
jgi:hypothetical protein